MSENKRVFGRWTAVRGKLSGEDAREAYVTGPAGDGVIRPLASFWNFQEAVRYAKQRNEVETTEHAMQPQRLPYETKEDADAAEQRKSR